MRASYLIKIFLFCALFSILVLVYLSVRSNRVTFESTIIWKSEDPNMKYILQWTSPNTIPFVYMGVGQKEFIDRKCPFTNCYVTNMRDYFDDYRKFDAIAFHGPEVVRMKKQSLPTMRSPHQKFVFACIESSDYYPVCDNRFDGYFNWTWTYKINSDENWSYIVVRDAENKIVGPKLDMNWIKFEDMEPVSEEFKEQLKTKTKAAAWFVSNCRARSGREKVVKQLQDKLKAYDMKVDIYGGCGPLRCPLDNSSKCSDLIKKDYYFYLSFENSFSEDYVTEKLLTGLKNNAVPIVFGAANYTRFMPDGIYLNARELGVDALAEKMNELIKNPEQYAEYFRWKKYYSYDIPEDSSESDNYCKFCTMLNDDKLMKNRTIYHHFKQWWNPPHRC